MDASYGLIRTIETPMYLQMARVTLYTAVMLTIVAGCGLGGGPRGRLGSFPNLGFGDPAALGAHSYGYKIVETGGTYYTLRGGTIDLPHLRGAADLTRAAYCIAYHAIMSKQPRFSVSPELELTTSTIHMEYPADWDQMPVSQKNTVARKVALILAPAVGYQTTVWHEMLTWKGLNFIVIDRQHESAFSWEDIYSNVLGARLAAEALQLVHIDEHAYNHAMTEGIDAEFQRLQAVPKAQAGEIAHSVDGHWFKTGLVLQRNMDVGFDDGFVTPTIIPGFTKEPPIPCPMPGLDGLSAYGFKVTYTISSHYLQDDALRKMAGTTGKVEPYKHFPIIMEQIEQEAREKYQYQTR